VGEPAIRLNWCDRALDLAADAGSDPADPLSVPGGPTTAVRAAFAQVASDNADDVRRPLGVLIEKVRATLASASRAAGVPESSGAAEWSRLMREMPPFVIDEVNVELRVALRNVLGKGVAHARLRSAIAAQAGDRIERALRAHSLALHEWSLRVRRTVRDEFPRAGRCRFARSSIGLAGAPRRIDNHRTGSGRVRLRHAARVPVRTFRHRSGVVSADPRRRAAGVVSESPGPVVPVCRASGTLVTKDDMLAACGWLAVTDNALTQVVSDVRQPSATTRSSRVSSRRCRGAATASSPRSRRSD
jgi:hypothetical protein